MNSYIVECTLWKCEALQSGLMVPSAPVNVCLPDLTTDVTERVNCSTVSPLSWTSKITVAIGGFTLDINDTLFPLKTYVIDNITSLINLFDRENNGSIIVCKLDESNNENWKLTILYPPELCSLLNITTIKSAAMQENCIKLSGNPNVTIENVQHAVRCSSSSSSGSPGVVSSLCEAVNRNNSGSVKLVGDKSEKFQLEILDPANIQIFSVNGFSLQNLKFNATQELVFKCLGNGNPPPKMKLLKDGSAIWSEYSFLSKKLPLSGLRDSGNYTCVAFNALGYDNATIIVSYLIERQTDQDLPHDSTSSIKIEINIILAGASALVLLVIIAAATCVYRMYRRMKSIEQSILPMTSLIATDHIDNTGLDLSLLPDQIGLYHEIDPHMVSLGMRQGKDGGNCSVEQGRNEDMDRPRHGDESQYLTVVAE